VDASVILQFYLKRMCSLHGYVDCFCQYKTNSSLTVISPCHATRSREGLQIFSVTHS